MSKGPEALTQKLILDWLAANHVLAYRMNTGAGKFSNADGKERFMKFGVPGMADILAFPRNNRIVWSNYDHSKETQVCWIEVKAPKGKQSDLQKSFQAQVQECGHMYILAYDLDIVKAALR